MALYCCIVKSASLEGMRNTTPFNLLHCDIESCYTTFESQKYPANGYEMNFGGTGTQANKYNLTEVYYELLKNLGSLGGNIVETGLTATKFRCGSTIICFPYCLNSLNSEYTSYSTADGLLSISLKFRAPTQVPLSILFFPLVSTSMFLHTDGTVISSA